MYNYIDKLLITGILLLSLFTLVLRENVLTDGQFMAFVIILLILSTLPMLTKMENFTNYQGSTAGRKYETKCNDKWRKEPCNLALNDSMGLVTQGSSVPLQSVDSPLSDEHSTFPSVDGVSDKNSMFMFAYNKSSPDCCPSTYTTSTGCVCTNLDQRKYLNNRGNNRSNSGEF